MATNVIRMCTTIHRELNDGTDYILHPRTITRNVMVGLSSEVSIANKILFMGICNDEAYTPDKAVTIKGFELYKNQHVTVSFPRGNSATNITLNITGTGAYPVYYEGNPVSAASIRTGAKVFMVFNGLQYDVISGAGGLAESSIANNMKFYLSGVRGTGSISAEYYDENIYTDANSGYLYAKKFIGDGSQLTNLPAGGISSGTINPARLPSSGVTSGTYGLTANATPAFEQSFVVPCYTVDSTGRITASSDKTVTLPAAPFLPLVGGTITKNLGRSIEINPMYIKGDGQTTVNGINSIDVKTLNSTTKINFKDANGDLITFGDTTHFINSSNYSGTSATVASITSLLVDSVSSASASGVSNKALTANQGFILQSQIDSIRSSIQKLKDPVVYTYEDSNPLNTNTGNIYTTTINMETLGFIKLEINVEVKAGASVLNASISTAMMNALPEPGESDYILVSASTATGRELRVTKGSNNKILIYVPASSVAYTLNDTIFVIYAKNSN